MASFLTICNDVARESGTFPDRPALSSTTDQEGRAYDLVKWVSQSYEEVQNSQSSWHWLTSEFSGGLLSGTREYAADALGISERFAHWLTHNEDDELTTTIYKDSDGRSFEQHIRYMDYGQFRHTFGVGAQATETGRPSVYSVDYNNRLTFYPTPDAAYTVKGLYYKSPQILAADDDEPEMPSQFHRLIQYKALLMLGTHDEAFNQFPIWQRNVDTIMGQLMYAQAPAFRHPGALA